LRQQFATDDYVVEIDDKTLEDIWREEARSSWGMPVIVFDENNDLTKDEEIARGKLAKKMLTLLGYNNLAGRYKEDEHIIILFPDAHMKSTADAEDTKKSLCQTLAHEFSHALCLRGALGGVKAKIHNFAQIFLTYRLLWYWLPVALFTWFLIVFQIVGVKLLIAAFGLFLTIILLALLAAFTRETMTELLARSLIKKYSGKFNEAVDVLSKPTL